MKLSKVSLSSIVKRLIKETKAINYYKEAVKHLESNFIILTSSETLLFKARTITEEELEEIKLDLENVKESLNIALANKDALLEDIEQLDDNCQAYCARLLNEFA